MIVHAVLSALLVVVFWPSVALADWATSDYGPDWPVYVATSYQMVCGKVAGTVWNPAMFPHAGGRWVQGTPVSVPGADGYCYYQTQKGDGSWETADGFELINCGGSCPAERLSVASVLVPVTAATVASVAASPASAVASAAAASKTSFIKSFTFWTICGGFFSFVMGFRQGRAL